MLLSVMPSDALPAMDRLSPSWIRGSVTPSESTHDTHLKLSTVSSLQPRSTCGSSNSDDSRSSRSSRRPSRRPSIRGMVSRLRSPSVARPRSPEQNYQEIDNWFYGFRKYNQLVSTQSSARPAHPSQEFAKACKALTKSVGGNFIHGLPEAVFDFSLLWCPGERMGRKDTGEPSWSWTGYHGQVNFPFDPTTCPDVYTAPRSQGEWFRSEIVNFHIGPKHDPYTLRREKCSSLRIKYPPYFHAPRGSDATVQPHVLTFSAYTISADSFTAEQLRHQKQAIPCSQLLNEHKQQCGVIMDFESSFSQPSTTGPFDFVLLSRNLRREHSTKTPPSLDSTTHPSGTPIWDGDRFLWDEEIVDFDDEHFAPGPWKMLNVMLVKWVGTHAERVAIARIHEDAWLQYAPEKRDITLQ